MKNWDILRTRKPPEFWDSSDYFYENRIKPSLYIGIVLLVIFFILWLLGIEPPD